MKIHDKQLVLSSTSLQRQTLLQRLQIPFVTFSPDIDETPHANETAKQLVLRLAEQKARTAAAHFRNAIIIGSDEVGDLNGKIYNKPLTHENAVQQLQQASGNCVRFFTGLAVFNTETQHMQSCVEVYDVFFRKLTTQMIEDYLRQDQPYHCAGSIKAEGLAITLIARFAGDDFSTLIGLPLIRLIQFLENV